MLFPMGVFIEVQNSGLPLWQEVPLTFLGCGIAYGLILGVVALVKLPGQRRLRRRVQAVEAAAGDGPVYAPAVVYAAGARLFSEVQAGWDARDRDRLARISDPDLMSDWNKRMDGYADAGERYRVEVLKGPRLEYISLLADHEQVRLRVRAKLRRGLESKGKRRALPEDKGRQKLAFEEYWTLSRSRGEWILWSTRSAKSGARYAAEPIVAEGVGSPPG
jgi:predicted lipid-binding transport protein (Tim44 family)